MMLLNSIGCGFQIFHTLISASVNRDPFIESTWRGSTKIGKAIIDVISTHGGSTAANNEIHVSMSLFFSILIKPFVAFGYVYTRSQCFSIAVLVFWLIPAAACSYMVPIPWVDSQLCELLR